MDGSTRPCAVLIDLSGTLHIDRLEIPGSIEALERLRKSGARLKFITNTTKECRSSLHKRLVELGFVLDIDEIFSSLTAARVLVERKHLRPLLLLEEDAKREFSGLPIDSDHPDTILVGLAPSIFNYEEMNKAFQYLLQGAELIATNKGRYYQTPDGLALGPGPFVTALEYATGKQSTIVGKPEASFFLEAVKSLRCAPEDCYMIGDDAMDDVGGAANAGIKGILVKTGKYRNGDELKLARPPYLVCERFSEAVDALLPQLQHPHVQIAELTPATVTSAQNENKTI